MKLISAEADNIVPKNELFKCMLSLRLPSITLIIGIPEILCFIRLTESRKRCVSIACEDLNIYVLDAGYLHSL